ncbi:MAG: hypothetical protein AW08_02778 [Candidatus Accumulibacter adjunctus]|uniref:Tetratricopeptide repeat protein n=1 Tax=Candidatus Accumulibacter adjunctus TaxID=1454001 RepID=A0A011PIF9_9PROT|nr:MAG: hypothetical protein AW08_02778 [Candidatus Accumulibacter adjunctus]
MTTRSTYRLILATYCLAMACCSAIAKEPISDVDGLIAADRWQEAARLIFLEARATNKHESAIVIGQARAGFVDDALDTINATHIASRSWLLMSLVHEAPSLSTEKRDELLRNALDSARGNAVGKWPNYLKSGDLARIALYYSGKGATSDAELIFSEAVTAAEKGLTEEGGGGFRQITELMRRAPAGEIKPWMLSVLPRSLNKTEDARSRAFACIDMVSVAARLQSRDLMAPFLDCSNSAIAKIRVAGMRMSAVEALATAKDEAGISNFAPSDSPFFEAIREARAGNTEKSYEIVSGLRQNLYVDHKGEAYEQVFSDAIRRGDLKTAVYLAERPAGQLAYREVSVWQRLAEKQIETGDRESASDSYGKASLAVGRISSSANIYFFDIQSVVRLAESMLRHGMKEEGRRTLLLVQPLLERISERRIDDRIKASIAVAEPLSRLGMRSEAKRLIRQAYFYAHSYDTERLHGDMEKARLLASIGQSISLYSKLGSSKSQEGITTFPPKK